MSTVSITASIGNGCFDAADQAPMVTPVAGCTYPDAWNAIGSAVPAAAQYANQFMTVLHEILQREVPNRNVKISIFRGFGDIAMVMRPSFEPFLDTIMSVLRRAGALQPNPVVLLFFFSNLG
ncbi:hypothetical protein B0H14DRAFT_3444671 [Mycena olivaceomarginata]|nr:hypothetical protein B0H14DRAFT_3444671 [Mycena olivaceomarginata]